MRVIFIYFLTLSIIVYSDDEDIIETNIVNLKEYSIDKKSYCKEKADPKNLIWSEDFNENYLSTNVWNYSTSNGLNDGKEFISGWIEYERL